MLIGQVMNYGWLSFTKSSAFIIVKNMRRKEFKCSSFRNKFDEKHKIMQEELKKNPIPFDDPLEKIKINHAKLDSFKKRNEEMVYKKIKMNENDPESGKQRTEPIFDIFSPIMFVLVTVFTGAVYVIRVPKTF